MTATLSDPRWLVAGTLGARSARSVRRLAGGAAGGRGRAGARLGATDRASPAPCLSLALVAGATLWAVLGGMVSLLVG